MDFHSGGIIVPKYISMATGDVICLIGQPSTRFRRVLYLWLYAKIDSFLPCCNVFSLLIACVVVGISQNICRILSMRSFSSMSVSNIAKKFCTTSPDLLLSSCRNDHPDCLQMFLICATHSKHFSSSSPVNVGISIRAGSKSLLSWALMDWSIILVFCCILYSDLVALKPHFLLHSISHFLYNSPDGTLSTFTCIRSTLSLWLILGLYWQWRHRKIR